MVGAVSHPFAVESHCHLETETQIVVSEEASSLCVAVADSGTTLFEAWSDDLELIPLAQTNKVLQPSIRLVFIYFIYFLFFMAWIGGLGATLEIGFLN